MTDDYFSDINPRSMRRLMNVVYITGRWVTRLSVPSPLLDSLLLVHSLPLNINSFLLAHFLLTNSSLFTYLLLTLLFSPRSPPLHELLFVCFLPHPSLSLSSPTHILASSLTHRSSPTNFNTHSPFTSHPDLTSSPSLTTFYVSTTSLSSPTRFLTLPPTHRLPSPPPSGYSKHSTSTSTGTTWPRGSTSPSSGRTVRHGSSCTTRRTRRHWRRRLPSRTSMKSERHGVGKRNGEGDGDGVKGKVKRKKKGNGKRKGKRKG